MRVAIIGSRDIKINNIERYMPEDMTLLISGGARGVDSLAEQYADKKNIPKKIFLPDYRRFDRYAPFVRNRLIVDNADYIVAIWNGESKGTKFTIDYAKSQGKVVIIHIAEEYKY